MPSSSMLKRINKVVMTQYPRHKAPAKLSTSRSPSMYGQQSQSQPLSMSRQQSQSKPISVSVREFDPDSLLSPEDLKFFQSIPVDDSTF